MFFELSVKVFTVLVFNAAIAVAIAAAIAAAIPANTAAIAANAAAAILANTAAIPADTAAIYSLKKSRAHPPPRLSTLTHGSQI